VHYHPHNYQCPCPEATVPITNLKSKKYVDSSKFIYQKEIVSCASTDRQGRERE
jgi:hypothetical protein